MKTWNTLIFERSLTTITEYNWQYKITLIISKDPSHTIQTSITPWDLEIERKIILIDKSKSFSPNCNIDCLGFRVTTYGLSGVYLNLKVLTKLLVGFSFGFYHPKVQHLALIYRSHSFHPIRTCWDRSCTWRRVKCLLNNHSLLEREHVSSFLVITDGILRTTRR